MAPRRRENSSGGLVSMTAFGRGVATRKRERVEVEMKGVNSRSLDLMMRGVDLGATQEFDFREKVASKISRGRIDVTVVRSTAIAGKGDDLDLSRLPGVVSLLRNTAKYVEQSYRGLYFSNGLAAMLARGDVFPLMKSSPNESPDFARAVREAFDRAFESFIAMRRREGARLHRAIQALLKDIHRAKMKISLRARSAKSRAEKRIRNRMRSSSGNEGVDPQRLAQEISLILDRSDIAEEIERIGSHVIECESILKKGGGGKRLEFLAQELQREFNTIGSKAQDSAIQSAVVDAKVAIERMREQVQNVE